MIQPGSRLAHYEIVSALGKGGMGEVWRARDTRLGREVAIKTLPDEFAQDADRLRRFEREAKLLASLNHPNIASIFGFEEEGGAHFLVMELVEGSTLADRLGHAAIPVEDALKLALQIADALKAAHEKGVIHRDLKPANIKVTDENAVKVLDFGLAKAFAGEEVEAQPSNSPTLSMQATRQGVILGTAAYMSPEQAKGRFVDRRADIFAFGCVLYEMLTGRQSFGKADVTESLSAVISLEPDWNALPPNLHPRLGEIMERCLEKGVAKRYQDIGDVRADIERVLADPAGPIVAPPVEAAPNVPSRLPWLVACVAAVVGALGAWALKPEPPPESGPVIRFDHELADGLVFRPGDRFPVDISPDGRQVVYNTSEGLYLLSTNQIDARLIPGTDGMITNPTFSPNGEWIAYWDRDAAQIQKIEVGGGAPVVIADVGENPIGLNWGPDDQIVYPDQNVLMSVSANGGVPETFAGLTTPTGISPVTVPGGGALYVVPGLARFGLGQTEVGFLPPGATEPRELFGGAGLMARYLSTGHIVYDSAGALFARTFDPRTGAVGGAVPLIEDVQNWAVSNSGTLAYIGGVSPSLGAGSLVWVDRTGDEEAVGAPIGQYGHPRVSPDGTRIAYDLTGTDGNLDIWVYEFARGSSLRLTRDPGNDSDPIWTGDGQTIIFGRSGPMGGLFRGAADGSSPVERMTSSLNVTVPFSLNSDDSELVYNEVDVATGNNDVWRLILDGDPVSEGLLAEAEFNEGRPVLSPDDAWIAYRSDESGPNQIYVRPYPNVRDRRWTISTDGGLEAVWAPDGTALFYRGTAGPMMRVDVTFDGGTPVFGTPEPLFEDDYYRGTGRQYDIHPDGDRFLMIRNAAADDDESAAEPLPRINVVVNWDQELLERVPVD